jgi:nitroreductase
MNFKEIIKNTRSTRRFKSGIIITKDMLIELIDMARQTSSGKNMQPLKYIPIIDEKIKDEVYKPLVWAAHLTSWKQKESEKPSAYILVLNDTSIDGFSLIDSGIAMQTIMLGATSMGYSGCILASIDKPKYSKLFNLPSHIEPAFIIALGISSEDIKIVNIKNDTHYYRDKNDTHCVPKRSLEDIILDEK